MTDSDSVLDVVETEPSRLTGHAGELHAMLNGGGVEQRRAIAELLRDSAQATPTVVADHTGLLDGINGRLLPADRSGLTARLWDRLHRGTHNQAIEAREQTRPPQLEERSD